MEAKTPKEAFGLGRGPAFDRDVAQQEEAAAAIELAPPLRKPRRAGGELEVLGHQRAGGTRVGGDPTHGTVELVAFRLAEAHHPFGLGEGVAAPGLGGDLDLRGHAFVRPRESKGSSTGRSVFALAVTPGMDLPTMI